MSCEFCEKFDFSKAKIVLGKDMTGISLGVCNSTLSTDEQFHFCPKCGRKLINDVPRPEISIATLTDTVTVFYTKEEFMTYMEFIYDKVASLENGTRNAVLDMQCDMRDNDEVVQWDEEFYEKFNIIPGAWRGDDNVY